MFSNYRKLLGQGGSTLKKISKVNKKIKLINNSPFLYMPGAADITNAGNIDLIQAIRKATGADFFYVYDVTNKSEIETPQTKATSICYEKTIFKKDTIFITEFKPITYNQVKARRSYSYDYKYKLIDALSNQIVSSRNENCISTDNIDFNEFVKSTRVPAGAFVPTYNLNIIFPYNPGLTNPVNQFNPINWRNGFSNRKELKPFSSLKEETNKKATDLFSNTLLSVLSE